ncbi:TetR family transcriptional regulator [Actinoplanes sp. NPDC023936]|uniref:TetR/AcrR family transcriptional regulator n=1 Tax=Actinoplanes sp. NPDC023936 TaxID=3154910 RepID=UPI0033F1B177
MPKRALTPELIAATALELGDRDGDPAMSMRRIAAELGCDPMAIYRHFANREALLDAVADLALAGVAAPGPDLRWDQRLSELLTEVRGAALRHPGIAAHVAARPPLGANGRRLSAAITGALADAGLTPSGVVQSTQALIAYVAAALAMTVKAGARDERWHRVSAVLGAGMPVVGSEEQFAYGLRLMINGIRGEAAGGGQGSVHSPIRE